MLDILREYNIDILQSSSIEDTVFNTLQHHGLNRVMKHTKQVLGFAVKLGCHYGIKNEEIVQASLLHDFSGIIPRDLRNTISDRMNITLSPLEREMPLLAHQKLSSEMAYSLFNIANNNVLSAISCHTTLKEAPSQLDLLLFVSDKIKWDQDGKPPYLNHMLTGLEKSLEDSAHAYINFVMDNNMLKMPHPSLLEAKAYFDRNLK